MLAPLIVPGGSLKAGAPELIDQALDAFAGQDGFASEAGEEKLKDVLEMDPVPPEIWTAKVLLAGHYMCGRGGGGDEALNLANETIAANVGGWQMVYAYTSKVAVLNSRSSHAAAIATCDSALALLNTFQIEDVEDAVFLRMVVIFGNDPKEFADAFRVGKVQALIGNGQLADAEAIVEQVVTPAWKDRASALVDAAQP